MTNAVKKTLLAEFMKKPLTIFWVIILPQVILLLINLRTFWLISSELPQRSMHVAYRLFAFEVCLLLLGIAAWLVCKTRKTFVGQVWNTAVLCTHTGYLWYATANFWHLVPANIEPWIVEPSALVLYQFTFIMPGLFYAALRLACFDIKLDQRIDFTLSILAPVLAGALYYFVFISTLRVAKAWFPWTVSVSFFIAVTVVAFIGLLRVVVMSYNTLRLRGRWVQMLFAAVVSIAGPIGGLLLNKRIAFPADFQLPWIYVLAVVNGLIVLVPGTTQPALSRCLVSARSLTYPFTLYFFLVFLPFLPLSLPAVFAAGAGFLILVPVILFLVHTKKLCDDTRNCAMTHGVVLTAGLCLLSMAVLPGHFVFGALRDKASLQKALKYVYSPDYSRDIAFSGSVEAVRRTLVNLGQVKDGADLPYLSALHNKIVFENMVLPDRKIEHMYKLFTGEDLSKTPFRRTRGLWRLRGDWRSGVRRTRVNRQVDLVDVDVKDETETGLTKSRLRLTMHNAGQNNMAEFFRKVDVPQGVLLTDFRLKIGNEMVPGRIFERRTAMWIYRMIRDFTRRDPGILTYESPTLLTLNVYPFAVDETRVAEIEFQFPEQFAPIISIGDHPVELVQDAAKVRPPPVITAVSEDGDFFVALAKEQIGALPAFTRQPYLHFILDFSKGSEAAAGEYIERIYSVASKYGAVRNAMITAGNFDVVEVSQGLFALNDRAMLADKLERIPLRHQGALDLSRIIKHHLIQYRQRCLNDAGSSCWNEYPLFVVITPDERNVLGLSDMEFFSSFLPDCQHYVVCTNDRKSEEHPLWNVSKGRESQKVAVLKSGSKICILPAQTGQMQIARFPAGRAIEHISVYDPQQGEFQSMEMESVKRLSDKSRYTKGLDLVFDNLEVLTNPARLDSELASLVDRSKNSRVMTPSTSYIILERDSQWKMLKVKEKERLRTSEGLEFLEGDFDTPAPSAWILLLLMTAFYLLLRKKRSVKNV